MLLESSDHGIAEVADREAADQSESDCGGRHG